MNLTEHDKMLLDGLKFVKNAHIEKKGAVFIIRHYDTPIFQFDTKTDKAEALTNCSITSNKQIRYAIDFFCVKPENLTKTEHSEKWGFSK